MSRLVFAIVFLPALILFRTLDVNAQTQRQTVLDGAYSTPQAMRGQAGYDAHCGSCHGGDLSGVSAPALKGEKFLERWREDSLDTLFEYIRTAMPRGRRSDSPVISETVYLDLYTYMLQQNDYPAGNAELTVPQLANVQLVGKDGPKPVPDGALVLVVGCFTQRPDGQWILVNATDPVRTKKPTETTPEELNASATKPAGNQIFLVQEMDAVPDFSPDAHKGQRMQTKGFLVRARNAERINLTSISAVSPTCG